MKKTVFLLLFLLTFFNSEKLFSVEIRKYRGNKNHWKPTKIAKSNNNQKKSEDTPYLNSITLSDEKIDIAKKDCEKICIENLPILNKQDLLEEELSEFINQPISENLIEEIRTTILNFYSKQQDILVTINIPDQDITDGNLHLIVIESKLGKIQVTGNKWFKCESLLENINLEEGSSIKSDSVIKDLFWLNKNPFRQAYAVYTPGENNRTTDIEIVIKDRLPCRIYTGIDNTGNDITGNNRIFAGLLANTYKDQLLAYQFTTGSTVRKFQSHTLKYTIPLPWRNLIEFIAGYSYYDVNYEVDGIAGTFHSDGMSLQTSVRYDIPILIKQNLSTITAGFDFKRTNNNASFSELPVFGSYANLTQFMTGFDIGGNTKFFDWSFHIEGFYSPGRWVSDQTNARYQTIRAFAKNHYVYARSSSVIDFYLPKDFTLDLFLRWQISNRNLLPSETYGLGGYDTIRGYKERVYNGDDAILFNIDVQSPGINVKKGKLKFLAFFDSGWAWKNLKASTERKSESLFSIGPGIRYYWTPYITARLDWGIQLKTRKEFGSDHNRLHFSIVAGY